MLAQQKVVLQAGNSAITLEGGDITFSCPGTFTVKAGQHPFLGGESGAAGLVALPAFLTPRMKYRGKLRVVDRKAKPRPDVYYKIVTKDGAVLAQGVTDNTGRSITVATESPVAVTAFIGQGGWSIEEVIHDGEPGCGC